jgi:hypothetical protein
MLSMNRMKHAVIGVLISLVMFDLMSAYALFYSQSLRRDSLVVQFKNEGRLPILVFFRRLLAIVSRSLNPAPACQSHADPSPLYRRDGVYGYGIAPGNYAFTICPQEPGVTQTYRWTASIDADGGRRTAYVEPTSGRRIVVLGDSWIFGWALNEEQTFSWLLQHYVGGRYVVRNFAQTGGGSTQELITVRQIADSLGPDDVVVLGYGDYYNVRNVAASSRIKREASYVGNYKGPNALQHPRASLKDGRVVIDFIPLDCSLLDGHCEKPDVPMADMQAVTVEIYREIVSRLQARIVVLHLAGPSDDPVVSFLSEQARVKVIDARLERSPHFALDDIPGYDPHPGALAHYAYFRLVRAYLDASSK